MAVEKNVDWTGSRTRDHRVPCDCSCHWATQATTNISLKLPYILEWQAIFTQTSKRGPLTRYPTCMKRTLHVHVHVRLVQPKVNQAPNGYTSKEETTRWFRGNKLEALARLGLELGLGVQRSSDVTANDSMLKSVQSVDFMKHSPVHGQHKNRNHWFQGW